VANLEKLGEEVKRYGKELQIVSDPVNRQDDSIFVVAREEGTDNVRQVQVPRTVVEMARNGRRNKSQ